MVRILQELDIKERRKEERKLASDLETKQKQIKAVGTTTR